MFKELTMESFLIAVKEIVSLGMRPCIKDIAYSIFGRDRISTQPPTPEYMAVHSVAVYAQTLGRVKLDRKSGVKGTEVILLEGGDIMPEHEEGPCSNEKPLTFEDVLRTVVIETEGSENPVSVNDLHTKHYPQYSPEKVRQLLNYLVETGQLNFVKDGLTKRYHPSHVWPKPKPEKPASAPEKQKERKVLGFECEICGALVGVRAKEGLFVVTCGGCSSEYLINRGTAMRLHDSIEALVCLDTADNPVL